MVNPYFIKINLFIFFYFLSFLIFFQPFTNVYFFNKFIFYFWLIKSIYLIVADLLLVFFSNQIKVNFLLYTKIGVKNVCK